MRDPIHKEHPTNKRCKVCGGMIVERCEEYVVPPNEAGRYSPPIPGEKVHRNFGYHCSGCGIEYHKVQ